MQWRPVGRLRRGPAASWIERACPGGARGPWVARGGPTGGPAARRGGRHFEVVTGVEGDWLEGWVDAGST
eukprot:2536015-Alexandrium_andersonii.AAC.1